MGRKLMSESVRVLDLMKSGEDADTIATSLPASNIVYLRRKLALPPRKRGRRGVGSDNPERDLLISEMAASMSQTAIGKIFGISRQRVNHILLPERINARLAIARAIEKGFIIRPSNCSCCGQECSPESHHSDYSKPMDIIWLCTSCHNELKKGAKKKVEKSQNNS